VITALYQSKERQMKKVSLGFMLVALLALIAVQLSWATPSVSAAPLGQGVYHWVLPGQNLYRISMWYGVSQHAILAANPGIVHPNLIKAYTYLWIPGVPPVRPGFSYTVQPGDTLYSLAWQYGTTVWAIKAANPGKIWNANLIYAWDVIWIP
jgi:LysM repeat protein